MSNKTANVRDPYAFSLRGATSVNGVSLVPAVRDDALQGLQVTERTHELRRPSNIILAFENFLARYLAPGRCHS